MSRSILLALWAILLFSTIDGVLSQEVPRLVYVQEVFRHGHREPLYSSKLDGSNFIEDIQSPGELTNQGKSMHYILGQNLYNYYWGQLFDNTVYSKAYNQSKFYVKSTNVNRTIESVQSQLLGIFQNLDRLTIENHDIPYSLPQWPNVNRAAGDVFVKSPFYHSLPVHVEKGYLSPWDQGDFLRTYSSQFCPNQNIWMETNKQNADIKKIINDPAYVQAIESVGKVLNTTLSFWDLYKYYDNAVCMTYDGRTVNPIWNTAGPTKSALDSIYNLDMYMKLYYQEQQLAVTATGFFNETYKHFKRITADQSGVQWAFYSAHDTTVGNFLARLNLTNVNCIYENFKKGITKNSQTDSCIVEYPIYTSNIIFEVYKYKNNTFTFKIRYNGDLRKIPFCDNKLECPIEKYYSWFESWKVADVVKDCGIVNEQQENAQTYFSIAVLEFGLILCFLIASLYSYLSKKEESHEKSKREEKEEHKEENVTQNLMKESLISDD